MAYDLDALDERSVYTRTGCLPACDTAEYDARLYGDAQIEEASSYYARVDTEINLEFFFKTGRHEVMEQYLVYDYDSLMPDIGGYMGLILGYSLFTFAELFTECCKKRIEGGME